MRGGGSTSVPLTYAHNESWKQHPSAAPDVSVGNHRNSQKARLPVANVMGQRTEQKELARFHRCLQNLLFPFPSSWTSISLIRETFRFHSPWVRFLQIVKRRHKSQNKSAQRNSSFQYPTGQFIQHPMNQSHHVLELLGTVAAAIY